MNPLAILLVLLIAGLIIAFTADLGKVSASLDRLWDDLMNATGTVIPNSTNLTAPPSPFIRANTTGAPP